MTGPTELDAELVALRARRIAALKAAREPAAAPDPSAGIPTELSGSALSPFLSAHPRVVIDVWAPWCGPCRTMAPILDGLAREFAGSIRFGKLNADAEPTTASRFGVEGIPTLLLFSGGRLVGRLVGARPADRLRRELTDTFGLGRGPGPEPGR